MKCRHAGMLKRRVEGRGVDRQRAIGYGWRWNVGPDTDEYFDGVANKQIRTGGINLQCVRQFRVQRTRSRDELVSGHDEEIGMAAEGHLVESSDDYRILVRVLVLEGDATPSRLGSWRGRRRLIFFVTAASLPECQSGPKYTSKESLHDGRGRVIRFRWLEVLHGVEEVEYRRGVASTREGKHRG